MKEREGREDDFVRIEIETALRLEKPVLPLLLGGAKMPGEDEVPEALKPFTYNHGVEIDTGRYFNEGMERLCADLDEHIFKGHVSRKSLNRGLVFTGLGVGAALIVALLALKFAEKPLQPDIERTADSAQAIAESTAKTARSAEESTRHTEEMAESLGRIAESFESLKTDGIIDNPSTSNEYYHNARLHELEGDYGNARRAYLGYFESKEDRLDPHLRFTAMLRLQEGPKGRVTPTRRWPSQPPPMPSRRNWRTPCSTMGMAGLPSWRRSPNPIPNTHRSTTSSPWSIRKIGRVPARSRRCRRRRNT